MTTLDVTGQPGGPSPDEQARVDAEQLKLVNEIRVRTQEDERIRTAEIQSRQDAATDEKRTVLEQVRALTKRVEALEDKVK